MTEVPGTDRDQARENVLDETPLAPEDVEGAETAGDEGPTGESVKPEARSTEPGA